MRQLLQRLAAVQPLNGSHTATTRNASVACLPNACPMSQHPGRVGRSALLGGSRPWAWRSAGVRLGHKLGLNASRNTLLRLIRRAPMPDIATPSALGVDDWALRKRHTYEALELCSRGETLKYSAPAVSIWARMIRLASSPSPRSICCSRIVCSSNDWRRRSGP